MKNYRRKEYTPAWPFVVGIVALLVLSGGFGFGLIRALELSAVDLEPVASVVIEAPVVETVEPVEPVEEEPIIEEQTYTDEDLDTLALIIYQEAGGDACSDETRRMVGTVVLNRVESTRFPNTIKEVALQRAQYGRLYWTGLKWPERASKAVEAHAVARAYEVAEQLLNGDRALPADVVYQAEFTQGTEVVAHQDGIYFCR